MKKRRLFLKIMLIILAILLIFVAAVVSWQWDNIKSIYYFAKYDDEKIDELILKHNDDVKKILDEHDELQVRPSTPVEEKLHQSGIITDNEFMDILTGKTDVKTIVGSDIKLDENKQFVDEIGNTVTVENLKEEKKKRQSDSTNDDYASGSSTQDGEKSKSSNYLDDDNYSETNNPTDKSSNKNTEDSAVKQNQSQSPGVANNQNGAENDDKKVEQSQNNPGATASEYIARLYMLKSGYSARVDSLLDSAIGAYHQLSAEDKKNAKSMLMGYYNEAVALQQQCDGEVNAIVSELTAVLKANSGDTSIVDSIMAAYREEVSLKKAQCLNRIK